MLNSVPPHATFTVTLSQLLAGPAPVIKDAKCTFSYTWDFKRNMGLAHLISINDSPINITLHPLGISGILGFMSDIPPTPFQINGQTVVIYRVILDIYLSDGERAAAIMFNKDGSVIEATANWRHADSAGLAP